MINPTETVDSNEMGPSYENPLKNYMEQMGNSNPQMKMMMEWMENQKTDSQASQLEEQFETNRKLKSRNRVLLKKIYQMDHELQWLQKEYEHLEEKNEILRTALSQNKPTQTRRLRPTEKLTDTKYKDSAK